MSKFEKIYPPEGMWAPLKVRSELRQMFEHWLLRFRSPRHISEQDVRVDELSILDLCQHYRLEYPGGSEEIAKNWDKSEVRISEGAPIFDDLVRLGWLFFDGCRWVVPSAPIGTHSLITYPSESTKSFLSRLSKARLVAKTDSPPSHAKALAERISAEEWLDRQIPTKDPDWLASKLWAYLCPKSQSHDAANSIAGSPVNNEVNNSSAFIEGDTNAVDRAFLEWSTWCNVLGSTGRWDITWGSTEKRCCREAAQRALERQTLWGTWENDVLRYTDVLEKTFAIPQDQLRYYATPRLAPPQTLVSRVDWLKRPDVEHLMVRRGGESTVGFAFGLLCSELEETDIGASLSATAAMVLSFAAEHPMALQDFIFRVNAAPVLLVDMLMLQHSACLAAKLAVEWKSELGRDNVRNVGREAQTKAFAVQDALSLLAYHLREGNLDTQELASLITWCYDSSPGSKWPVADSRRSVGRQLLGMVAGTKEELQSELLRHLVSQMAYEDNVPRACFAGVLDGLNCFSSVPGFDARPIVELYSKFVRDLHLEWTDVPNLTAEQSAKLVATAFAQSKSDRDALLVPFDSAKLLSEAQGDEKYSLHHSIARTLRLHVRLLARAVTGWSDEAVPKELSDAFQSLISRSVIEHAEKGRVGALTDRYRPSPVIAREDGSPAQDLAAAWRRLDDGNQVTLLQTLAQSDDPVLLSQLCQHLPAKAKPVIQARLRQLKPEDASALWTWPEVQHRIESLLLAGEFTLAQEHLDAAEHLERVPPEFRLSLFSLRLQLLLKEKNWIALDEAVVPSSLNELSTRQAQELLDFYLSTSQLLRPNGNLAGARDVLQRLAARPGAASAFKENVFAVAIQQLLGTTFRTLVGNDAEIGASLLAEIDAAVAENEKQASSNLLSNRAILLIALQRPEDALESVAVRRRDKRSPDLEHIAAFAKSEMGDSDEAIAILNAAITEFGTDDQLVALKNDLEAGTPTPSFTSPADTVDTISSIRSAIQQLTELPNSQVAEVLGPSGRGLLGYLVREVSRAVAPLQRMAAMLRNRKNPDDEEKFENDLNTAVKELLGARLAVAKWDVADQSLGGKTASGNPGERDVVIRASGQEISIYEALVCSSLEKVRLSAHFEKLLKYGICSVYFHVTYSYAQKLQPLLDYVRYMLEHEVPSGLIFLGCVPLEPSDYETSGYIATYSADHREVPVVFLIVDLGA